MDLYLTLLCDLDVYPKAQRLHGVLSTTHIDVNLLKCIKIMKSAIKHYSRQNCNLKAPHDLDLKDKVTHLDKINRGP